MRVGIVMDPIERIKPQKDTTFAIMLELQAREAEIYYIEPENVWLQDGITWARMQRVSVQDELTNWYELADEECHPLVELDLLFLRKDPPFDQNFLYLTYLLELAESQGLFMVNRPGSVRDANEKLYAAWFPQCCPATLVTTSIAMIEEFVESEGEAIIKPLDAMGGHSIFRLHPQDANVKPIAEMMTQKGRRHVMVQRFIEDIQYGDKRILLINGEPVPYALARVPAPGDFRGNLAAGARGEGRELTDEDRWICEQVGPMLRSKGLYFVGLDVIGKYLTEINVTSPTCVRELDRYYSINIAEQLLDAVTLLTSHA